MNVLSIQRGDSLWKHRVQWYTYYCTLESVIVFVPFHSLEMELSIQYYVTIINESPI